MHKGELTTRPGHVRVTVLDPIPTAGRTPDQARQFARLVQDAVEGALRPGTAAAPSFVSQSGEASA